MSFFCCGLGFITGIVAIILGVVAKNQIKQTGQDGDGLATAGIVIGGIAVIWGVGWFIFSLVSGSGSFYYGR